MKKVLSMIVTTALVLALFGGSAYAGNGNGYGKDKFVEFKDMKGHWGYQSVQKMQSFGIFNGYTDGTFKPDNTLTQAELAVIIDRLIEKKLNSTDDDDEELTDDSDDDEDLDNVPAWAKKSVKKGFEHGYFDVKRFHSHVQVDRLEACVRIAKALEEKDLLDVKSSYDYNPFKDKGLFTDEDDYRYIIALYEAGFIKGNPNGNFNPNAFLNRAEMASIIANLIGDDDEEDSDDENAPTWDDATITASAVTADSVKLTWSGAEDNEGVTGYMVTYKLDDDEIEKLTKYNKIVISGLDADTEYTFTVEARDADGNWSNDGPDKKVTTQKSDLEEDTTAPTWDDDAVLELDFDDDILTISWPDADGNDVYKYFIYQGTEKIGTVYADEPNSFDVENPDDGDVFKVRAVDEAGNKSISLTAVYEE